MATQLNQKILSSILNSMADSSNEPSNPDSTNRTTFCPYCGQRLNLEPATLFEKQRGLFKKCSLARCCKPEPLVVLE